MRAVTPPLGDKRKVYSFEFEKNKKMEKFGKKILSNLKVTVLEQVNQAFILAKFGKIVFFYTS